jgi:hypothetical protein
VILSFIVGVYGAVGFDALSFAQVEHQTRLESDNITLAYQQCQWISGLCPEFARE